MNDEEDLDLLNLDNDTSADNLPEAEPFVAPKPKRPWLLISLSVIIILLAIYIIIRAVSSGSSSSVEVDLETPATVVEGKNVSAPETKAPAPIEPVKVVPAEKSIPAEKPAKPQTPAIEQPKPEQKVQTENVGSPVRVIEDRKEIKFNPSGVSTTPAVKSAPKKSVPKTQAAHPGSWYVQIGSYSTHALAETAGRKISAAHKALFADKQFVILAAVLKNGTTTYRLRVPFSTSQEANGFCRNAKSDGLDCYVAR